MCVNKLELSEFNLERIICEVISVTNVEAINSGVKLYYNIDERLNYNINADINKLRYVILNSVQYLISSAARNAVINLNVVIEDNNLNTAAVKFEISNSVSRSNSGGKLLDASSPVPSIEDELINSNNLVKTMGGEKLRVIENKDPNFISISFKLNLTRGGFIPGIKPNEIGSPADADLSDVNPCKILLVEDNYSNAQITIELLTQYYNHRVIWVENGALAVEAVAKDDYDAVLMDIQMPVMDGFEASRQIRAGGVNTPIIALTAAMMPWTYDECINLGMDAFISKPAGVKKLGLLIKNTIEKRKVQKLGSALPNALNPDESGLK